MTFKLALQFPSKLLVIFCVLFGEEAEGETKMVEKRRLFLDIFANFYSCVQLESWRKSYKLFPYLSETCLTAWRGFAVVTQRGRDLQIEAKFWGLIGK